MNEIISAIDPTSKPTTVFVLAVGGSSQAELLQLSAEMVTICSDALPTYKVLPLGHYVISIDPKNSLVAPIRGYVLRDLLVDIGIFLSKQGFFNLVCVSSDLTPKHLASIQEASTVLWKKKIIKRFALLSISALIAQLPKLSEKVENKTVQTLLHENSGEIKSKIKKIVETRSHPIKHFKYAPALLPWNSSYWTAWILTLILGSLLIGWALMVFSFGIDL